MKVIEDFKHIKSKENTIHILRAAILNVLQRMPKWITLPLWTLQKKIWLMFRPHKNFSYSILQQFIQYQFAFFLLH